MRQDAKYVCASGVHCCSRVLLGVENIIATFETIINLIRPSDLTNLSNIELETLLFALTCIRWRIENLYAFKTAYIATSNV